MGLGNVITICATIVICFLVVATVFYKCLKERQETKKYEIDKKLEWEKERREKEITRQKEKDKLDSAWRCLNDFYKKNETTRTKGEEEMAAASWEYLKELVESKGITN